MYFDSIMNDSDESVPFSESKTYRATNVVQIRDRQMTLMNRF